MQDVILFSHFALKFQENSLIDHERTLFRHKLTQWW